MIELTRRATFSASHTSIGTTPGRRRRTNRSLAGVPRRNGHGHNYTLEVTVASEPDPVTGFVVDLKWLRDVIEDERSTRRV